MNHQTLALDQVAAGMRLATDLHDDGGAILLAAGSELSAALLNALSRRGIERVAVVDESALVSEDRGARVEIIRARLAHLFRRAGDSEADRLLFEALLDYRLEQLG